MPKALRPDAIEKAPPATTSPPATTVSVFAKTALGAGFAAVLPENPPPRSFHWLVAVSYMTTPAGYP